MEQDLDSWKMDGSSHWIGATIGLQPHALKPRGDDDMRIMA